MIAPLSRRQLLASVAGLSATALLAACSDSGKSETDAATADAATSTPAPAPAAAARPSDGSVDMAEALKPGPLPEKQLGKDDAKVTIIEYASMTCPHCARFEQTVLPDLKTKYIDTGKVRLIFREFPFDPRAEAGFMLARCSNDNYFAMIDVLFKQQESWAAAQDARSALLQLARLAGFTQESFEACLTNQKLLDDIRAVRDRAAKDFKVDSTPTFFIDGKVYKGEMTIAEMSAIIDPLL